MVSKRGGSPLTVAAVSQPIFPVVKDKTVLQLDILLFLYYH